MKSLIISLLSFIALSGQEMHHRIAPLDLALDEVKNAMHSLEQLNLEEGGDADQVDLLEHSFKSEEASALGKLEEPFV